MSHEITETDTVVLMGEKAWHNLGIIIDEEMGALEAAQKHGLCYPVDQWKIQAHSPAARSALEDLERALVRRDTHGALLAYSKYSEEHLAVDTHVANVRIDNVDGVDIRALMGVVGRGYSVCQTDELAEFVDALGQTGKVVIETVGTLRGGKKIWFLCRGESFNIGGVDKVTPYFLICNSHDGSSTVLGLPTSIRTVCANTLRMALRGSPAAFSIRHSGSISNKLEEARNAIRYYDNVQRQHQETLQKMNATPFSQVQAITAFTDFYASEFEVADAESLVAPASAKERKLAERRYEKQKSATVAFLKRYDREARQLELTQSKWSAFNAISGWLQHDLQARGKNDEARTASRVESNLFGLGARRTNKALDLVMAVAS